MFGLTKGAMLAISTAVATAAVGALAYRAWQAMAPAPIAATTAVVPVAATPAAPGSSTATVAAPAPIATTTAPAPIVASVTPAPAAGVRSPAGGTGEPPKSDEVAAAARQKARPAPPDFDVVRVEPTGDAVVAGRAAPNAEVALLDRGSVIAETKADANGQFVFVPPALHSGDHLLALGEKSGSGRTMSTQTVTVAVPQKKASEGVIVALTEPNQPTRLLSDPAPSAAAGPQKPTEVPAVAIRTVETEEHGGFFATGSATPGAEVKLYLNGAALADVRAGRDGKWSLRVAQGMQPGSYAVRADQIDAPTGKVIARAEVPFDYRVATAAQGAGDAAANRSAPAESRAALQSGPPGDIPAAAGNAGQAETRARAPKGSGSGTAAVAKDESPARARTVTQDGSSSDTHMVAKGDAPSDAQPTMTENSPSDVVVAAISTVTVVRGDSLWRISRKVLGHGIRYTQIYIANASQIRDPRLIYPGQVLVKPQIEAN